MLKFPEAEDIVFVLDCYKIIPTIYTHLLYKGYNLVGKYMILNIKLKIKRDFVIGTWNH